MTANGAAVIADDASEFGMIKATAMLLARGMDTTSDMSSVLRIGADIGQRISGKRKGTG